MNAIPTRHGAALRVTCTMLVAALASSAVATLQAQETPGMLGYRDSHFQRGEPAAQMPRQLERVGVDPMIGEDVPLDLVFTDAEGERRPLSDFVQERPVVLVPAFYTCPMLCEMVTGGLAKALRVVDFEPGRDYDVVVFSFDPADGPEEARAKREETRRYQGGGTVPGWHFLTGEKAEIDALTEAIGFRYAWDEGTEQFAHTAAAVVLTPSGRVSRYFFGIEFAPRSLRLGLVESAEEQLGSIADQVMLFCFQYDPSTGKYSAAVLNLVRGGGLLTIAALGLFIFISWRRGRSRPEPC